MTTSMKFNALTIAARISLAPQPQQVQPPEPDPAQSAAAMGLMAQALSPPDNEAVKSREGQGNVRNSDDSRAGEEIDSDAEVNDVGARSLSDAGARQLQDLRVLVASRIVAARETLGLAQFQLAHALGYKGSAQVSQWEGGSRVPPIIELPRIARVLGCSTDFLLGVSEDPERDVGAARRGLLVQHLRDQLESVAGHLADAALESGVEVEGVMRANGLLSKCLAMQNTVQRFEAANASSFDDMPCGAMLRLAARELGEAAVPVGAELDAVAKRRERAARRAKLAMSGGAL